MSTRRQKVPVNVDTLMYWETVVRLFARDAKETNLAGYAKDIAEEIHQHVLKADQ